MFQVRHGGSTALSTMRKMLHVLNRLLAGPNFVLVR